jgi:hypothetical protein
MKLTKGQVRLLRRIDSRGREAANRHYHVAEKLEKKNLIRFGVYLGFATDRGEMELKKREGGK